MDNPLRFLFDKYTTSMLFYEFNVRIDSQHTKKSEKQDLREIFGKLERKRVKSFTW